MPHKWKIFWLIITLCSFGTIALGYISYTSTPPSSSTVFIETVKTIFLCLGGLGVILPLYINATNAIESRVSNKIENTFSLIEKWDDPHLFSARKLTREIRDSRSAISDDELVKKIKENEEMRQSVILVCNYFEQIRFSVLNDRIDAKQFSQTLGPVVIDIINRFMPYFKTFSDQHVKDLEQLKKLIESC